MGDVDFWIVDGSKLIIDDVPAPFIIAGFLKKIFLTSLSSGVIVSRDEVPVLSNGSCSKSAMEEQIRVPRFK
jgi:hypothetical protein